jgi:DNA-binding SARP family transcriptional activator
MEGIRLLGPVSVHGTDGPRPVGGRTRQAVLALLAVRRGHYVPARELRDAIWAQPGSDGDDLRALRNEISRLRVALTGIGAIGTGAGGYRLVTPAESVDAEVLELRLREAGQRRADTPQVAITLLEEVLALWSGRPFGDLADSVAALGREAARLEELRLAACEQRFEWLLELGADPTALSIELSTLVEAHPFRERLWGFHIVALYRGGRQADALAAYRRLHRILVEELGVTPSVELAALEHAVLAHDPSLLRRSVPQDPDGPVRRGITPADSTNLTHAPRDPAAGLTRPLDRFFGRSADLGAISALLDTERLVTITGPAGGGKTRLAIEVALRRHDRFPDGVWFCELASTPDGAAVGYVVAERIGVKQAADRSIVDSLADWAAPRQLMIVLDNCEHVRLATAALCATLLARCPGLVVLATSREPLGVRGERMHVLPPLLDGAAELFMDRSTAVGCEDADPSVVAAICERVDHGDAADDAGGPSSRRDRGSSTGRGRSDAGEGPPPRSLRVGRPRRPTAR